MLREQIRALDIGPDRELEPLQLTGNPTAAVVSGSIVALDGSLSEQHQRDVIDCMLLAQLAANVKADRHKDPSNWYKVYQQTLESIGWVVQASASMSRYLSPGTRFTMSSVITDLFRRKVGPEELGLVTLALNTFKRDPAGPAQFVFECPSHSGGIGNFQFGLATEEEQDTILLQIGRFAFRGNEQVTRLAFHEFPPDASFQAGFVALTTTEQTYRSLRSAVSAKIASRISGSVTPLELAAA